MSSESASVRQLAARIGGLALASQRDPMDYTAAARATFLSKFETDVDPDGTLSPAERARRAEAARSMHFTRLALRSTQARRRRAKARQQEIEQDE